VEGGARAILRLPVLAPATIAFLAAGIWLWRPIPVQLSEWAQPVAAVLGGLLLVGGCALYLCGLRALGVMFGPSSGFGVALHAGHRLIDAGPYALVRHPMYLAVMLAAWGSLMLYRTWATLAFAIMMLGVIVRAQREERVLSDEFGEAWREYAARVPCWFPLLRRRPPA
jgi:protein-S-isoprenylcysteine O-methyltransferase Ste14